MKCLTCDHPAEINNLCEGCYDDLCRGGDDATQVAEKLIATITAQHDEISKLKRRLVALGAMEEEPTCDGMMNELPKR